MWLLTLMMQFYSITILQFTKFSVTKNNNYQIKSSQNNFIQIGFIFKINVKMLEDI